MNTTLTAGTAPHGHRVKSWLHLPVLRGVIERRVLVNFRCDPEILARVLPKPFRVQSVGGFGVAGICLIRLRGIRPPMVPAWAGLSSENAAHRIAVEWEESSQPHRGVFIPRRDTDSRLNHCAGGRLFPGVHHAADFRVWETGSRIKIEMRSRDVQTWVRVLARVSDQLPPDSVFRTLEEAATFFRSGAIGWSARPEEEILDGLELQCRDWRMSSLIVERVESSFFSDRHRFPPGSTEFDSAFLMRDLAHEWRARGQLRLHHGGSDEN